MAKRRAGAREIITPAQRRELVARASASVTDTTPQHTAALPPPANWPVELRRLVAAQLDGLTWEQWARPFAVGSHEPMWLLLRVTGRRLRRDYRVITNEEAWTRCVTEIRSASTSRAAA